jgi:hypothetical protein
LLVITIGGSEREPRLAFRVGIGPSFAGERVPVELA